MLIGAKMERATIDAGALEGCVVDPSEAAKAKGRELRARLDDAESWIRSNGKIGSAARLDDEDLRPLGGLFRERLLTALSARGVQAIGVDFSASQLQGANFRDADLRGAVFDAADLRGACFENARLAHARFGRAILAPLHLIGGRRIAPSFKGAGLERTDFTATAMAKALT